MAGRSSISADDPFEAYLRPPPNETPTERESRLKGEREALRISQEIDEVLKAERIAAKKSRTHEVKCLLLGQEGSGKTTTLKQFLLNFSQQIFANERAGWRAIVFLNVINSFRLIIENLAADLESSDGPSSPSSSRTLSLNGQEFSFTEVRLRLAPVLALHDTLMRKLAAGDEDSLIIKSWPSSSKDEVTVRSGTSWKRAFERHRHTQDIDPADPSADIDWNDRNDPGVIINACRDDMLALWASPDVQEVLRKRRITLEDSGFFLDELERITAKRYIPSNDDILRARLKTIGASVHTFSFKSGPEKGIDWKLYDVGGSRTQRQTWAPFFDDVNAILFLAPISAFDQVLSEDRRVNRLEDSLLLWTELCKNKILSQVPLILFLNKCDLLKHKLQAGVQVKKYVTSYGDRPNELKPVTSYFRAKFEAVKKYHSATDREVFIHMTSMTDTKTTGAVIASEGYDNAHPS